MEHELIREQLADGGAHRELRVRPDGLRFDQEGRLSLLQDQVAWVRALRAGGPVQRAGELRELVDQRLMRPVPDLLALLDKRDVVRGVLRVARRGPPTFAFRGLASVGFWSTGTFLVSARSATSAVK